LYCIKKDEELPKWWFFIDALVTRDLVRIRSIWLKDHNLNINTYLTQYMKVFEDFKLMAEMREDIDKLKN